MGYWTILIFCSVLLAVLIIITWYSVKKQNDRSELGCEIGVLVAISFIVFALVLTCTKCNYGGKKIYVDEFPPTITLQYFQFVKTESEYLISLKILILISMKNAKYCISYTALTKNVLNIEKVDK